MGGPKEELEVLLLALEDMPEREVMSFSITK
jgi:hypothetical protein